MICAMANSQRDRLVGGGAKEERMEIGEMKGKKVGGAYIIEYHLSLVRLSSSNLQSSGSSGASEPIFRLDPILFSTNTTGRAKGM